MFPCKQNYQTIGIQVPKIVTEQQFPVLDFSFIYKQHDYVPRSDWSVVKLKEYCLKNKLNVVRQDGKNKAPVRKDYYDAARLHAEQNGLRYKADSIMKSYGIRCVRLPPYHPGIFNPKHFNQIIQIHKYPYLV